VRSRIHRGRRQLRDYLRASAGGAADTGPASPPRSLFGADE
jgi:hypothetical protein